MHIIGYYRDYEIRVRTTDVDFMVGDGYALLLYALSGRLSG